MANDLQTFISHIAKLARLQFPPEELALYGKKCENILKYIEQLNKLTTDHVEATSHAVETHGGLRPDKVVPSHAAEEILAIAPERDERFIQVPKVIDA